MNLKRLITNLKDKMSTKSKQLIISTIFIIFIITLGLNFIFHLNQEKPKSSTSLLSMASNNQKSDNNDSNKPSLNNENEIDGQVLGENINFVEFKIPILMYHYIRDYNNPDDQIGTNLSVSPEKFNQQLKWLKDNGYQTIDLDYLLTRSDTTPFKPVILTFDDGYQDAYTNAFPILQKYDFTAVFYIITDYINNNNQYMTWEEILELKNAGMNIGSHTATHPDLSKLSDNRIGNELIESKKIIEKKLNIQISDFCYPSGKYNERVINKLKEIGYKTATTTHNGVVDQNSNLYELPRIRMTNNTNLATFLK